MNNKNNTNSQNSTNNKNNRNNMQGTTQAIVTPDSRDNATNRAVPNDTHVKEAKDFVDQNKK